MDNLRVPPHDASGELLEELFKQFVKSYRFYGDESALTGQQRLATNYMDQISSMIMNNKSTLYVNFGHVMESDAELAEALELEFYRFEPHLRHALQQLIFAEDPSHVNDQDKGQREFFVAFYNFPHVERIRAMGTDKIGRLISISGTVTRTTEVRPELMYGAFLCKKCGSAHPAVEQQFQYTEPTICKNPQCKTAGDFQILVEKSVFVDWQRLRVQENADEIPAGSMPRCVDVICRNEVVEQAKAGDKIIITGAVIVVPDTSGLARIGESAVSGKVSGRGDNSYGDGIGGLKKLGVKEMTYKVLFVASSVQHTDQRSGRAVNQDPLQSSFVIPTSEGAADEVENDNPNASLNLSEADKADILRMHNEKYLYHKLVDSFCPSVFGHLEVKRGVLLMLFGGVHKKTPEGISLRGDLNVCIVGDPSCAKSQFLKYVHGFLPRTVYTSGKSSSAAGLTASVVRDAETGEFCVEAGALMLADNGICCIDEFDKMDPHDQVAIHEAMEQQTISITKAGIQATLNARTSILAAANPVFGRYDRTKTLKANIAVSAAIMSRFDLFFVILDECNPTIDEAIARHIVGVHKEGGLERASKDVPFTREQIQRYIQFARTINPIITPEAAPVLVECFRLLRSNDLLGKNKTAYRITVRQLESLVRLSEAIARLHLNEHVYPEYVREAYRLLQKSIILVENEDIELEDIEEEMDQLAQRDRLAMGGSASAGTETAMDVAMDEHVLGDAEGDGEGDQGEAVERRALREYGLEQAAGYPAAAPAEENKDEAQDVRPAAPAKKKKSKVTITSEEYHDIRHLLKLRLRGDEEGRDLTYPGILWSDLRNWYLAEIEKGIAGAEALEAKRKIVELVMRRLMKTENCLVEMPPTDAPDEQKFLKWSPLDP